MPLPLTQDFDSPRIVLVRPGVYDATVFKIDDVLKVTTMIQDILMNEDDNDNCTFSEKLKAFFERKRNKNNYFNNYTAKIFS